MANPIAAVKLKAKALLSAAKGAGKGLLSKGAAHIFIGSFLTKFVSFFSSIFLVNVLSKQDFGILTYMDNLSGYFQVFMGMGMCYAILRYAVLGKDDGQKYSYYRYSMESGCKFNIALILISVIFTLLYRHQPSYQPYRWMLVVMVAIIPMKFIAECSLNCQRALFDAKRFAAVSFIVSTLWVTFRLLGGIAWGFKGVILFALAVEYAIAIVLLIDTRRRYFRGIRYVPPQHSERREILTFAAQYMITNSLWAIFMLNDTFLLGHLIDNPGLLAEYKTAYVLPANLAIISSSIGIFIGPYFTKHEHDGDIAWVRRNWLRASAASAGLLGAAALILFIFAKPIILLMYGEEYLGSVSIMRILLIAAFFNTGIRYITAHILSSMGKVKYNMIISAVGMAMQISLNLYLIPRYPEKAAVCVACTSVFVYLFMAIALCTIFIKKYFLTNNAQDETM
ncbi:MAG: oligosaccharide flippase family protein [Clostridia bacterium]|nr:oligosaccharide flippase family protein [Clostridia bacterium]